MFFKNLTPNMMVEDVRETIRFYTEVMGFHVFSEVPNGDNPDVIDFAILGRDAIQIMLQARQSFEADVPTTDGMPIGASQTFYVDVEEVDEIFARIVDHVEVIKELHSTWYNTREVYFRDLNGYIWCLSESLGADPAEDE
jgi:uncharacterized glyoxalase superfamily protein PhnB